MRRQLRTLPATHQLSYAGVAKTDTIELPRDYALQRILIDIRGTADLTAVTLVEDAGQRLIDRITLQLTGTFAGNKTIVDISGVDLYFLNFYQYGAGLERVTPTNGAASAISLQLCLDFRLETKDPDDFAVAIPLFDTSSATLKVEWVAAATGYAAAGSAAWNLTGKITLIEGIPQSEDEFNALRAHPVYTLTSKEFTCATGTGREDRNNDIEVGHLLRRLLFIARTSAGARSDTEIEKLTLKRIDETYYDETDWDAFGLEDESDYKLTNYDGNRHIRGMVSFDFARGATDERGRIFGIDLTPLKSGDMKFAIWKNNASSKIRYITEAIIPRAR